MMTDEARIKKNKDETRGRHMNTDEGDYIGRVYRGGSIYYKGKSFPASYRNDVEPKYYNVVTMGFRVALYI